MKNHPAILSVPFAILLILMLLVTSSVVNPVRAGAPEQDGRINQITWVNSWGAVAVYCLDSNKTPADNFTKGAIVFLNPAGQEVFRVADSVIAPKRIEATETRKAQLIHTQGYWTLWALPDGYFQITTPPDVEGKTSLAVWKNCEGPRQLTGPTPTPDIPR